MTTDQPWRHHSLDPQEPTVKVVETLFKQKKVVETFLTHCIPKEIVIAKKKQSLWFSFIQVSGVTSGAT
jgi:hypothetical protein